MPCFSYISARFSGVPRTSTCGRSQPPGPPAAPWHASQPTPSVSMLSRRSEGGSSANCGVTWQARQRGSLWAGTSSPSLFMAARLRAMRAARSSWRTR